MLVYHNTGITVYVGCIYNAKARSDAAKFLIRASGFYGQSIEPVGNTDAEDIEKAWRMDKLFDFDFG